MLTLYDFGNSVCCQKVRITMRAKGLDWESVEVDLFRAEQYAPKYLKLNPKGVVPTLVHNGKAIFESTLICEYLDDTFPEPRLIPADPWLRATASPDAAQAIAAVKVQAGNSSTSLSTTILG
jgi:glutathione S-transferase